MLEFAGGNITGQLVELMREIRKKRRGMSEEALSRLLNGPLLKTLDMLELKGSKGHVLKFRPMMTYGARG